MDIYEEILVGLRANDRLMVATIIGSKGSTPVPAGAKMLIKEHAAIPIGTVGGGCVEADIQEEARRLFPTDARSLVRRFTLTEDDIESGMLCGGTIDILIERLSTEHIAVYATLLSQRDSGIDSAVVTLIGPTQIILGKVLVSPSLQPKGIEEDGIQALRQVAGGLPASFDETLRNAIDLQTVVRLPFVGGEFIVEPVIGLQDLIIFGGGHVSRYVSRSAAMAGFRVTIVDDRLEYANPQRFPEAHETLAIGFETAWGRLQVRPSTSIVIVTRGHKFDEIVLECAVRTPARYIGMIGSRRKVISTFKNLVERGIPSELLRNVHAPIGLAIGALTAEEIGISITAELISARRGVLSSAATMSDRRGDF
jgi:xanthine dehydrogenase accessory factor